MIRLIGEERKIDFIKNNRLILKYHCENTQKDDLKCCCGDKLGINSDVYLFSSYPKYKDGSQTEIWAGSKCGKRLIALSNEYNGTTYKNPPLLKTGGMKTTNEVVNTLGWTYKKTNSPSECVRYTSLNLEFMVGIYILGCWKWKYPVPDRLFGKILWEINSAPGIDLKESYISRFKKAAKNENFNLLLQKYRVEYFNAFPNFTFRILADM